MGGCLHHYNLILFVWHWRFTQGNPSMNLWNCKSMGIFKGNTAWKTNILSSFYMNQTWVICYCCFLFNVCGCVWLMQQKWEIKFIMIRLSQSRTMLFFNISKNMLSLTHGQTNTKHKGEPLLCPIVSLFSHCYAGNADIPSLNEDPSSLAKAK